MLRTAMVISLGTVMAFASAKEAIHTQLDELAALTKGKRLGILTNGSARTADGLHDVDYLMKIDGTTVTAFFGPEHGFRGDLADGKETGDGIDEKTGVPVYSLYGKRKEPSDEQLKNVDVMVFDIPDVGVRFYTYSWTLTYAMDACARNGKQFIVVDRPNPITGTKVEGAVNTAEYGLVGRLGKDGTGVATRHGFTLGEQANYWNNELTSTPVDLKIIKVPGWKRDQWLDDFGAPFIAPSPNMRTLACATVYPGTCIFEGTNLSEGRGTTAPFELMGAPFVDGKAWADDLNALKLPGVKFEPAEFTPEGRRWKGEKCGGVQIVVTDRNAFDPVPTGIHMLQTVKKRYPDQVKITDYAGRLMAVPKLEDRILKESVEDLEKEWQPGLEMFKERRKRSLLY